MTLANPIVQVARALVAAGRHLLARYRWMDAQIWQIAKTDAPGEPQPPNQPPKIRCC